MKVLKVLSVAIFLGGLGGCGAVFDKQVEWEVVQPDKYPVIHAIGYAPINAQRGQDASSKMLMALKAL